MRTELRITIAALLAVASLATPPATVRGDLPESAEERYLAGLRERRLYFLVEAYCKKRLEEAYTVDRRRAELTVELSRTALEAALFAKSPEREALAAKATKIIDDELRNKPSSAWRPLLDVQRGLVDLIWGERLREEAQFLNSAETQLEPVRERLRAAVAQLKQVKATIEERLRDAGRTRPGVDQPTADHWFSMRRNVDYQLGRAYRNQGESYPAKSADRLSALEQAVETFESLTRAELTDPITWQARLEEVTCKRLLGDLTSAEKILDLIDANAPPADIADQARAQRIRVRIAANRLDEARKFLTDADTDPASSVDPDVRLAALEWLIASAAAEESAGRAQQAAEVRSRAEALTKSIAQRQAPYWARKAEALTASAVASSGATSNVGHADSSLMAAAASFYRQGNFDKALEIYDQLFAQAWSKRQQDVAFDAAFTAGAVEQQRKKHAAAAARFEKLAATIADHPRAAEAQLLAAYNLGLTLLEATPEALAPGLENYARLLEAQVKQWPAAKETDQARVWLGKLRVQQRQWDAAAQASAGVASTSPLAPEAVQVLAAARTAQLAALQAANQPTDVVLAATEKQLGAFLPAPSNDSPPSTAARAASIASAKLKLAYGDATQAVLARTQLENASRATDLAAEELAIVNAWLTAALLKSGAINEAVPVAERLAGVSPNEAAAALATLNVAQSAKPNSYSAAEANIVMKLLAQVPADRKQLPPAQQAAALRAEARTLEALGRAAEARARYENLARTNPADGDAQLAYAEYLSQQTDRESLTLAVKKWREVERASTESSTRWYRARLGLIQAYVNLGDAAKAKQLLELTEALHPELGGPAMKAKFGELLSRVK
jgi:tetratricopeptide (TPR) repeat protein